MSSLGDWLNAYLQALPATLRASLNDGRFIDAGRMALHHGWTPQQAARAVEARGYKGAHSPVLLAIVRLEDIAAHPPGTSTRTRRTPHPNGCLICQASQTCPDPVLELALTDQIIQRWRLVFELMQTPGIDEDTREQAIIDLIAEQRR